MQYLTSLYLQTKAPTIIEHDNHEYIFEGFSLLSHEKLENVSITRYLLNKKTWDVNNEYM